MILLPIQIWLFWSAILLSNTTHAADVHIVAHTVSRHLTERANGKQWNEANAGLGVRYQLRPDWSVQAGAYRNSINRTSAYAIAEWTPVRYAGLFAGAATGYADGVRPVGGALLRWDNVTVRLAPRVISLELSWPL